MLIKSLSRPAALLACLAINAAAPRAAGPRDSLTVTPASLGQHLQDPNLVVLQVGRQATYDAGHIPGARFIDFDTPGAFVGFVAPPDPAALDFELPPPEALRERLVSLGITDHSKIVVAYSDEYFSPSTRVIFTLDYAGLSERTTLLEGGLTAWKKAGLPVTTALPTITRGTLSPLKTKSLVVDAASVQTTAKTPGYALVDGRAARAYEGVPPPSNGRGGAAPPVGHIPGALSIPFSEVFNEREELRSPEELEQLFAKAGVKPGDTVVGYCWIGQQATAMLFAARTLGHPVKLYDGSINDWTAKKLPLETVKKGGGSR
jgi:thiosulfate/3-mercaptopyruvate sulfurtransferase